MSLAPWIIGGVAAGGVFLWYRSRMAAKPPQDDACAKLCKASGPYCIDGGASCRAIGDLLKGAGFDTAGSIGDERKTRQATNDKLNGEADITNPVHLNDGGDYFVDDFGNLNAVQTA